MKKNSLIKLLSLSLIMILASSCGTNGVNPNKSSGDNSSNNSSLNVNEEFSAKEVNLYIMTSTEKKTFKIYTSDARKGIPYIEINDLPEFLNMVYEDKGNNQTFTVSNENENYFINRESSNGSYLKFDFKNNTIYASNRDKFTQFTYKQFSLDVAEISTSFYDEKGNAIPGETRFLNKYANSVEIPNRPFSVDLNQYNIELITSENNHLIPLTTFWDVCSVSTIGISYNGHDLFLINGKLNQTVLDENGKSVFDLYYEFSDDIRSDELIKFNYNELCLNLDTSYGLKETHNITSNFDDYFTRCGMKDLFLSKNKNETDKAYTMLQYSLLADNHSAYDSQMPYEGYVENETNQLVNEVPYDTYNLLKTITTSERLRQRLVHNNLNEYGAVSNPYQEVGDTAIITFDSFTYSNIDLYYTEEFKAHKEDYIYSDAAALISYAQDRISSSDHIKRVIIDLSGNGGGSASTAVFILGWLQSGIVNIKNVIDGGMSSIFYTSDVNFDKVIDSSDYLTTYVDDIYCVTSNGSFSCGNLVPCMLKEVGKVKLIGTQSGGGACSVKFSGTADGTIIQFSSRNCLCTTKNGSYYSIDQGATPDYYLNDYDTLYGGTVVDGEDSGNRANLINYIKKLEGLN